MSSNFICEICNSSFSNKYSLANHKKTAKKCLKLQNTSDNKFLSCNFCNKTFTSKHRLEYHTTICVKKIDKENQTSKLKIETFYKKILKEKETQIENLQEQVKNLQKKLSNIAEIGAKKNTTNNTIRVQNNVVNQLVPYDLDRDKIRTIVNEKFTENHLYEKENGVINFAVTNLLKDDEGNLKMTCTDTSRKIFIYKDMDGNLYKDPDATGFTEIYIPEVKRKSFQIISDKEDTDILDLTEYVMTLEPVSMSHKLATKLVAKPTN